MFDKVLKLVTSSTQSNDHDFADQINFRFTPVIYMTCSLCILTQVYFSNPIQCWTPTYFSDAWNDYTNNFCFIRNTYFLPMGTPIEVGRESNETVSITYYQWIPIILMILALCFYLPRAVWFNIFAHHFVDINSIVDLLTSFDNAVNPETRDPAVRQVAYHINRYIHNTSEYRQHPMFKMRKSMTKTKTFFLYFGRRYGLAVTLIYFGIKLCYIFVTLLHLYFIDTFLRGGSREIQPNFFQYFRYLFQTSYVLGVLGSLFRSHAWSESPSFPRITLCDFRVRTLGQVQNHTVQCVLPINLFNEKIFLFLWVWLALVLVLTIVNLILWSWRIVFDFNREKYIVKHLKLMGKFREGNMRHYIKVSKKLCKFFIHGYLRPDGVFLIRLIAINTNCLIASEIIAALWDIFLEEPVTVKKAEKLYIHFRKKGMLTTSAENMCTAFLNNTNQPNQQNNPANPKRTRRAFSILQPSISEDPGQVTPNSNDPVASLLRFQEQLKLNESRKLYPQQSSPKKCLPAAVGFSDPRATDNLLTSKPSSKKWFPCISEATSNSDSDDSVNAKSSWKNRLYPRFLRRQNPVANSSSESEEEPRSPSIMRRPRTNRNSPWADSSQLSPSIPRKDDDANEVIPPPYTSVMMPSDPPDRRRKTLFK